MRAKAGAVSAGGTEDRTRDKLRPSFTPHVRRKTPADAWLLVLDQAVGEHSGHFDTVESKTPKRRRRFFLEG
jgi:hypothetical protein